MRTHRQIIEDANGATALAGRLFPLLPGRWSEVRGLANTVQGWKRQGSIPSEYWPSFAEADIATVEELAAARAEAKLAPGEAAA